eukprot:c54719_g1_i1 orf=112-267(-)
MGQMLDPVSQCLGAICQPTGPCAGLKVLIFGKMKSISRQNGPLQLEQNHKF